MDELTKSIEALAAVTRRTPPSEEPRWPWGLTAIGAGLGLSLAAVGYQMFSREGLNGSLPTQSELSPGADLETNWGKTPAELRPLFMLMEEASGVVGLARTAAVVAFEGSNFDPSFHDTSATAKALSKFNDRPGTLKFHREAANFGVGGLFAMSGTKFLHVFDYHKRELVTPFWNYHPKVILKPRVSALGAGIWLVGLSDEPDTSGETLYVMAAFNGVWIEEDDNELKKYLEYLKGKSQELGIELPEKLDSSAYNIHDFIEKMKVF